MLQYRLSLTHCNRIPSYQNLGDVAFWNGMALSPLPVFSNYLNKNLSFDKKK